MLKKCPILVVLFVCLLASGCGRVGFDSLDDGSISTPEDDGSISTPEDDAIISSPRSMPSSTLPC